MPLTTKNTAIFVEHFNFSINEIYFLQTKILVYLIAKNTLLQEIFVINKKKKKILGYHKDFIKNLYQHRLQLFQNFVVFTEESLYKHSKSFKLDG